MKKRQRRSYQTIFLDTPTELSDAKQPLIGNKTLRDNLGWD